MKQIHPDQGLLALNNRLVTPSWEYHLFTNNIVPDRDTELADLAEMSSAGYSPIIVLAADFTIQNVGGHIGTIIAAPITFVLTSSGSSIYGYYVVAVSGSLLLAVGRFDDAPISLGSGATIQITPVCGDNSKFSS